MTEETRRLHDEVERLRELVELMWRTHRRLRTPGDALAWAECQTRARELGMDLRY